MGTITPNIGIYVPSAGETNYDAAFQSGMVNIDQHDHSGGPNKGLPISASGLADGSVTYTKLNANVADTTTGIGPSGSLGANQLAVLGLLQNIYKISTTAGLIAKNGSAAEARTIVANTDLFSVADGDGASGDPTFTLSNYVKFDTWTPTIDGGGASGTITYTSQIGNYSRIGFLAFVNFTISWTAIGTASGELIIGNLPFTIKNSTPRPRGACTTTSATYSPSYTAVIVEGKEGTTTMGIQQYGSGVAANVLNIWSSGTITGSLVYVIDF